MLPEFLGERDLEVAIRRWGRGRAPRTLALKLRLHSQHIVKPIDFGRVISGLKVIEITQIVPKLCLPKQPTLFVLNVCHRSIKTAVFSVQCSLGTLLFTSCIRLRNMSVINV